MFTSSGRQHHPGLQGALSWVDFELNPDGFEAKEQLKHMPRTCTCTFSSLPCLPLFQEATKPAQALGSGTDSAPCTASATSLACPQGWWGWQPGPAATWSWGQPTSSSWIVPKSGGRARTPQHLQEATKHLSTSLNQLAQVFKQPLNSLPVLKPHSVQSLYSSRNRTEKSN